MMNFCVVVKVSRRSVTFWYQTEGKRYTPLLLKGVHEVPLYFYVGNNQFDFGANARDRFYQHDPNAFGDYFELIKDPSNHFILHNSSKRVKQLLYYGIEQFLSRFLNKVLYKNDSIEAYRRTFPLKFIFESDLGEPERDLVADMFTEAGYRTISVLNYNAILLEHLRSGHLVSRDQAVLMLTGLEDTLYLELYVQDFGVPVSESAITGQGADPRIRVLAELIVGYILEQNPFLDLDMGREVNALLAYSAGLLADNRMILTGEAELIHGSKFWFRVNLKSVEDRLQYYSGDMLVASLIDDLLKSFGIRQEDLVVLLCNDQIRTPYFSERLFKQYPHVKSVEPVHADETMQLIFSRVSQTWGIESSKAPIIPRPPVPSGIVTKPPLSVIKPPLPVVKSIVAPVQQPPLPMAKSTVKERPRTVTPPPLPPIKKKS